MNYPNRTTQRDVTNLCETDNIIYSVETCACCKRGMVNDTGVWHDEETGRRIPNGPIDAPNGYLVCSQTCLSQHIFNTVSPADKAVLREMARAAYAWFVGTDGCGLIWRLKHSSISPLVSAQTVTAVDTEIRDLLKDLAGEDFLNGDEDGPEWFQRAVGLLNEPLPMPMLVKPAQPEEFVGFGLEVRR